MKLCSKCKMEKDISEFRLDVKSKDGYRYWCKKCSTQYQIEWRNKNFNYNKEYMQQWKLLHSDYGKQWELKNSESRKLYHKNYNDSHIFEKKVWRQRNKEKLNKKAKERRKTDLQYVLSCNLRRRLNKFVHGIFKSGSAVRDLGCSIEDLKIWLEQQFELEMTWDNYGTYWNIDHIIPLSTVDLKDLRQLKKVCHWFNLRPLKVKENISRGNKI